MFEGVNDAGVAGQAPFADLGQMHPHLAHPGFVQFHAQGPATQPPSDPVLCRTLPLMLPPPVLLLRLLLVLPLLGPLLEDGAPPGGSLVGDKARPCPPTCSSSGPQTCPSSVPGRVPLSAANSSTWPLATDPLRDLIGDRSGPGARGAQGWLWDRR